MAVCSSPKQLSCYLVADIVPIVIVGLMLFLATIILLCCILFAKSRLTEDVVSIVRKIADLMLSDKEPKGSSSNLVKCLKLRIKTKESKKMIMKQENFRNPWILGFFMFAVCFSLLYIFTIFWDTFLIDRREDNCVEGLDCFLISSKDSNLLNCSEHEMESTTAPIICYRLRLNIGQAWADAGGAIAASSAEFLLIAGFFEFITRYLDTDTHLQRACVHIALTVTGFIVYATTVLPSLVTLTMDKKKFTDVPKVAYTIILFFQIFIAANIPWYLAYEKSVPQSSIEMK